MENKVAETKKRRQFISSNYYKRKKMENGKYSKDHLDIVYRNLDTGEKCIYKIEEPTMDYYMIKEECKKDYYQNYVKREDVILRTSKFNNLIYQLGEEWGSEEWYDLLERVKSNRKDKDDPNLTNRSLMSVHQCGLYYSSDMDIEDFYKGKFLDTFSSDGQYLTKGYFDIEVDGKDHIGFPDQAIAPCSVNAITYIDEQTMGTHVFLLRNSQNKLIKELEDNVDDFIKELDEDFRDDCGEFSYYVNFYDEEIDLIKAFFDKVNELKPDFVLAWNINFDLNTLINRIKRLGYNPEDIICHPDFSEKMCYFYTDKLKTSPDECNDSFTCSSYTTYIDQLLYFAKLRKGQQKFESYSLNFIAQALLGDTKLDYTEIGEISELPYLDYKLFVKYNIKDVMLCYKLEQKNNDTFLMYIISSFTRTRINYAMKKTISIKNMITKFASDLGLVIGNNMNINYIKVEDDGKPKEKFSGGIVADPNLNDNVGIDILGKASKYVHDLVIDYDLRALYPSIFMAYNVSTNSQYGRLIFINNDMTLDITDKGGQFLDDLSSREYSAIANRYFNAPLTDDLIRAVNKKLKNK